MSVDKDEMRDSLWRSYEQLVTESQSVNDALQATTDPQKIAELQSRLEAMHQDMYEMDRALRYL